MIYNACQGKKVSMTWGKVVCFANRGCCRGFRLERIRNSNCSQVEKNCGSRICKRATGEVAKPCAGLFSVRDDRAAEPGRQERECYASPLCRIAVPLCLLKLTGQNAGTIYFHSRWWNQTTFPKAVLRDCRSKRAGMLMHSKMLFVRHHAAQKSDVSVSSTAVGFAYVGSANLSESAW